MSDPRWGFRSQGCLWTHCVAEHNLNLPPLPPKRRPCRQAPQHLAKACISPDVTFMDTSQFHGRSHWVEKNAWFIINQKPCMVAHTCTLDSQLLGSRGRRIISNLRPVQSIWGDPDSCTHIPYPLQHTSTKMPLEERKLFSMEGKKKKTKTKCEINFSYRCGWFNVSDSPPRFQNCTHLNKNKTPRPLRCTFLIHNILRALCEHLLRYL